MHSSGPAEVDRAWRHGVSALRAFVVHFARRPTRPHGRGYCCRPSGPQHLAALLCVLMLASGCAQQRYVTLRERPRNVLANPLRLLARGGPKPTPRTLQLLRRYDLVALQEKNPEVALTRLRAARSRPIPTRTRSARMPSWPICEGQRLEAQSKPKDALDYYGAAVAHAYWFLLDPKLDRFRNPYDPQFRRACDLYNESLAAAMRMVIKQNKLRPGETHDHPDRQAAVPGRGRAPRAVARRRTSSGWSSSATTRSKAGLTNQYHTYGLGVPLIAVRGQARGRIARRAVLSAGAVLPGHGVPPRRAPDAAAGRRRRPPLHAGAVRPAVQQRHRRLQSPGAAGDRPHARRWPISSTSRRSARRTSRRSACSNPNQAQGIKGPVHGRAVRPQPHSGGDGPRPVVEPDDLDGDVQRPAGLSRNPQPLPVLVLPLSHRPAVLGQRGAAARDAGRGAADARPAGQNPNLDQLVLVGHSMGGLVSKLQTLESGDEFWRMLTDKPIEELKATPEERARLAKCVLLSSQPVGEAGRDDRHAAPRQHVCQRLHARAGPPADHAARDDAGAGQQAGAEQSGLFQQQRPADDDDEHRLAGPGLPDLSGDAARRRGRAGRSYHNIVGVVPKKTFLGRVSEEGRRRRRH